LPEIPDLNVYVELLRERLVDRTLHGVRLASPFFLRTFTPPLAEAKEARVVAVRRLAKRIVLELSNDLFLVLHLMVSGRLRWGEKDAKIPGKIGLAAFDFDAGTLLVTEASPKKRASLHVVRGAAALDGLHAHGLEVEQASLAEFAARLVVENRTLKRFLTDPRLLAGIGNAYSDEILHRAQLSPVKLTRTLGQDAQAVKKLYEAIRSVLGEWTARLWAETAPSSSSQPKPRGKTKRMGDPSLRAFPEKVTAFRPEMAVHGKFGQPCPVCGTKVQHIVYAENECNYCPRCQTGGKLLADRSLSRLLHADWPKTIDDLEAQSSPASPASPGAQPPR
jgi:formamidopyrimidine-DNA glycosylase